MTKMILNALALLLLSSTMVSAKEIEMKPRPTDEKDFPKYIKYLVEVSDPRSDEERKHDDAVKAKYKDSIVIDSLWVGGPGFPAGFTNAQYEEATQHSIDNKFTVISATITNSSEKAAIVKKRMAYTNQYWADHAEKFLQVRTVDDIYKAKKQNKLGVFHNFQSMDSLDEDVKNVEAFYKLGLRQMNVAYNADNAYGSGGVSNEDGTDTGLTELGKKVIKEMNRVGVVVDCSHSSNKTCIDAAVLTSKPMVMSHSNSAALQNIGRNASDEAIKAVGSTGGVVCVNYIGGFLNPQGDATPFSIAKHVQHVRNLIGVEATCSGSDYVFNYGETLDWVLKNPKMFPPSMGYGTPSHMGKPSEVWGIVRVLQDTYGWTDKEIQGFLGENIMRVYKANWK